MTVYDPKANQYVFTLARMKNSMIEMPYSEFFTLLQEDTITLSEDIKVLPKKTQIQDKIYHALKTNLNPTSFSGTLDGNGHTIHDPPDMLFSEILEDGLVKDVTISGCNHNSVAVVCETNKGYIENVTVDRDAPSEKDKLSGGLVKDNKGVITECCFEASIESEENVGGISGSNSGEVSDCSMSGDIHSHFESGGICGVNVGSIINCEVSGSTIKGNSRIGGVVGKNESEIRGCKADCITVDARSFRNSHTLAAHLGGISGMNSGEISDVTVDVSVISGKMRCGGIVGNNSGDIQNSTCSSSNIGGEEYIGGLAGGSSFDSTIKRVLIEKCAVRGQEYVGGIVGQLSADSCIDCVSNASVCGEDPDSVGAIFGELKVTTIESCIYYGSDREIDLASTSIYDPESLKAFYDSSKEEVLSYVTLS